MNSGAEMVGADFEEFAEAVSVIAGVSGEKLKNLIIRIERLEEEKEGISCDIRDVFSEAKAQGFDVKVMRQIIKLRAMNTDMRREQEEILDLYKSAIGLE